MPAASGPDASHLEIRPAFAFSTPDERAPTAKIPRELGVPVRTKRPTLRCAAHVPELRAVFCGREDGAIVFWKVRVVAGGEVASSREMVRLLGHRGRVTSLLALRPAPARLFTGGALVSGGADATVRVWDARKDPSGAMLQRLPGHEGGVVALAQARAYLVSGSTDATVRVWRPGGRAVEGVRVPNDTVYPWFEPHRRLAHTPAWVTSLSFGATEDVGDHGSLFVGCADGSVLRFRPVPDPAGAGGFDWRAADRDDDASAAGSSSSPSHQCVFARPEDGRGVTGVLYVPEERCVCVLAYDAAMTIRDARTGAVSARLENPLGAAFTAVAEMPPERGVAAAERRNAGSSSEISSPNVTERGSSSTRAAASSGSSSESPFSELALTDAEGFLWVYDLRERRARYRAHVTGSARSDAEFEHLRAGDRVPASALALVPEASSVAVVTPTGVVRGLSVTRQSAFSLVEVEEGRGCHAGAVVSLCVGDVGVEGDVEPRVFSASLDGAVRQWDPYDMRCVRTFGDAGRASEMACATFAQAAQRLVTGHDDGVALLWGPDSGERAPLRDAHGRGHRNTVSCCVELTDPRRPDDLLVATGGFDGRVVVWNVRQTRNHAPGVRHGWDAHPGCEILAVAAFAGDKVVTGGNDGVAVAWAAPNKPLRRFDLGGVGVVGDHAAVGAAASGVGGFPVTCVAVRGERLFAGAEDGRVAVWDFAPTLRAAAEADADDEDRRDAASSRKKKVVTLDGRVSGAPGGKEEGAVEEASEVAEAAEATEGASSGREDLVTVLDAGDEAHVVVAVHPMRVTAHVLVATRRRELGGGGKVPGPKPAGGVLVAWDLDEESGGGGGGGGEGPRPGAPGEPESQSQSQSQTQTRTGPRVVSRLEHPERFRCLAVRERENVALVGTEEGTVVERRALPEAVLEGLGVMTRKRGEASESEEEEEWEGRGAGAGGEEEDGEEEDIASQFEALGGKLRDEE